MKILPHFPCQILAAGLAISLPSALPAIPPRYVVTVLSPLNGGGKCQAFGVNSLGQVAGASDTPSLAGHAVRWTEGIPRDLATLGGVNSYGYAINDAGFIAGVSETVGNTQPHATVWGGSTAIDLGTLGGTFSTGYGINNLGQVVGTSTITGDNEYHAVRWTGMTPEDLGTLGGPYSEAFGINFRGQVAGYATVDNFSGQFPVRWTDSTPVVLGPLGPPAMGYSANGIAYGINNAGHVVGWVGVAAGPRAVLWAVTTPVDLGTLGGLTSFAIAINNHDWVIGTSETITGELHPFLYRNGTMYDLNDLLEPGSGVTDLALTGRFDGGSEFGNNLNDSGQIAAYGTVNGVTHALLLTPLVPKLTAYSFSPPTDGGGKRIQGQLVGRPNTPVVLKRSSNLVTWDVLVTITLDASGNGDFGADDCLAVGQAFYFPAYPDDP